jgi:hypothetical protein
MLTKLQRKDMKTALTNIVRLRAINSAVIRPRRIRCPSLSHSRPTMCTVPDTSERAAAGQGASEASELGKTLSSRCFGPKCFPMPGWTRRLLRMAARQPRHSRRYVIESIAADLAESHPMGSGGGRGPHCSSQPITTTGFSRMSQSSIQSEIDGLKEALALEQQYLLAGRARETIALAEAKLAAMDALETAFGSLEPGSAPRAFQSDMVEIVSMAKGERRPFRGDPERLAARHWTDRVSACECLCRLLYANRWPSRVYGSDRTIPEKGLTG